MSWLDRLIDDAIAFAGAALGGPAPEFPRPLQSLFETHQCPDCGHGDFGAGEDGGHDIVLDCLRCGSAFGIQSAPFNLIERVGHVSPEAEPE